MTWNWEQHAAHYRETDGAGQQLGAVVDLVGALESAGMTRDQSQKAVSLYESTDRYVSIVDAAMHVLAFSPSRRGHCSQQSLEAAVRRLPERMVLAEGRAYEMPTDSRGSLGRSTQRELTDPMEVRAKAIIETKSKGRVEWSGLELTGLLSGLPKNIDGQLDEAAFGRRIDLEIQAAIAAVGHN